MKYLFAFLIALASFSGFSQDTLKVSKVDTIKNLEDLPIELKEEDFLKSFSENACNCIDSIEVKRKKRKVVAKELSDCIDKQVMGFQMIAKLTSVSGKEGDQEISINVNEESDDYKTYYYKLERDLMENCESMKAKVAANDVVSNNSMSDNLEAGEHYNKGLDYQKAGEYKKALKEFQKAVDIDDEFAFAWDNLGLTYRQLGDYDKAIEAYNRSLMVEPSGTMPLQNLAVAYLYKEDFDNAIKMYEELAKRDETNPEVYYGLGIVYLNGKQDYEKSLRNMCQAYNLYIEMSSPYRTDAEKVINSIYQQYAKEGKEKEFMDILKEYNINPN